jgi:hypothetical protein
MPKVLFLTHQHTLLLLFVIYLYHITKEVPIALILSISEIFGSGLKLMRRRGGGVNLGFLC